MNPTKAIQRHEASIQQAVSELRAIHNGPYPGYGPELEKLTHRFGVVRARLLRHRRAIRSLGGIAEVIP